MSDTTTALSLLVRREGPPPGTSLLAPPPAFIPTIDNLIVAWLDEKYSQSGSEGTRYQYGRLIAQFRSVLAQFTLDLFGPAGDIAMLAQGWAGKSERKTAVSAATFNARCVVLRSFYEYAIRMGACDRDPMQLVKSRRVTATSYAPPMEMEEVANRLKSIDRSTLLGLRDYALITLAVMTGRRASELLALQIGDFAEANGSDVTVTWRRCKGNKVMHDQLPLQIWNAINVYLVACYGPSFRELPGDTPLWLVFNTNTLQNRKPLHRHALRRVWQERLGTPLVHATRHTFAVAMDDVGAGVSEIGARLGHSNAATTGVYLQRLRGARNPYSEKLAQGFGIDSSAAEEEGGQNGKPKHRADSKTAETREKIRAALESHPDMSGRKIAEMLGIPEANVRYYRRKLDSGKTS